MNAVRRTSCLVILAGLLAGACASAPPEPASVRDPEANWAGFATYGWTPAPAGTDQPLSMLDQGIRRAIAAEMQRRGYTESATDPDLQIAYQVAAQDKVESSPVRIGVGIGSWGGSSGGSVGVGSSGTRSYREGTLVIHAVDTERNAEVWQGSIAGRLDKDRTDTALVTSAVQAAMRDFPARN
jgi:hypothetical protein